MASPNLILITCSDDFVLSTKTQEVLNALVPEPERAFGLETIDAAVDTIDAASQVLRQTRDALVQQGFFSEGKTVWMRDVAFFDSKRLGKSDRFSDEIADFCDWLKDPGIPDGFTLLVTSLSVPKSGRFYKTLATLAKKGRAEILALPDPSPKEATEAVKATAEKLGCTIPPVVAEAVVARVGYAPRVLTAEIEKLCLYTNGVTPTVDDVEAICTANVGGEFWDLTDAFGGHDFAKTLKVLENLYEKRMEPIFLVMQLQARLNELYLIKDSLVGRRLTTSGHWAPGLTEAEAEAVGRLGKFDVSAKSPWILGRLMAQARNWTPAQLRHARKVMINANERMTSVSVNTKILLEMAIADALS